MKRIRPKELDDQSESVERLHGINSEGQGLYAEEIRVPGTIVGRIVLLENSQRVLIDFPPNNSGKLVAARSLVPLKPEECGCEVALLFEDGDLARPIIVGVLQKEQAALQTKDFDHGREIEVDRETFIKAAKNEIVIRCGKASITLTRAGKLLIQGEYVMSRSAGVNKIRGGSVQIN